MSEWRSNLKWTPVIVSGLAAIAVLGTLGMLTAPIALAIAGATGLAAARF